MPRKQIAKRENLRLAKKLLMVLAIVFLISSLMDAAAFGVKLKYDKKIQEQTAKINELSVVEQFRAAYDLIQKKYDYREKLLGEIQSNSQKTSNLMDVVEEIIPKDISLSSLSIDKEDKVSLDGAGDNIDSVLDFYHGLKTSGLSDYVTFNEVKGTLNDAKGIEFTITFKLKNGK